MMRKPIHCEDKHGYYNIIPPSHHTNTYQHQTHRVPRKPQYEEEYEWDHLEPTDCTGDSGYSGSAANYIKPLIYADCHYQNGPPHNHNAKRCKLFSLCASCFNEIQLCARSNCFTVFSFYFNRPHIADRDEFKSVRSKLLTEKDKLQNKS